jgi:hypothetical protein
METDRKLTQEIASALVASRSPELDSKHLGHIGSG